MTLLFEGILLHAFLRRVLERAISEPSPAYLFVGPDGIGKRTAAEALARGLLNMDGKATLESHPDFYRVHREEGAKEISVDVVRSLLERSALSSAHGGHRVMFMNEADRMSAEAANALLKAVEEPPRGLIWLFLAERPDRLPATLRSRLVTLRFERMRSVEMDAWLQEMGTNPADRERSLAVANGCPGKALRALASEEREAVKDTSGEALIDAMRSGPSGRALQEIEFFTKNVEASEDASDQWRRSLDHLMRVLEPLFLKDPQDAVRIGLGLIQARHFSERALSPRLALELAAIQPYCRGEADIL